jgi:hypothetical protein
MVWIYLAALDKNYYLNLAANYVEMNNSYKTGQLQLGF